MARYEIPVSTEEIQEQSFEMSGLNVRLTLYFNRITQGWQFDLYDTNENRFITQMQGLAVNAPALLEKNIPFLLILSDGSGTGINSMRRGELGKRLTLYAVDKEEWREAIRAIN